MGTRLRIREITPNTEEWTCKIQVIDKSRPKDNKERTKKYQLIILQDDEETKILGILFNGDITHFGDLFKPFHTYLVSVAQVKESTDRFGEPLNKFTWFIDRSTIVEPIEKITPKEAPLPPPSHLTVTSFGAIEYQPLKESEFDVLAILVNGESPKYAKNGKLIQEFIVMDHEQKPMKLTLWEEYIDHDGSELFQKLNEFPVILAKRITRYASESLSSRYSTTIHINPPYEQAKALMKWAEKMKSKLQEYKIRTTSASGSLIFAPFEEENLHISEIQMQALGKVFYIQAEISLQNVTQRFCSLACSNCKHLYTRTALRREIICASCNQSIQLIPRCQFEVTVTDNTGSTIATISDEPAQKLLFLTLEQIFDICCVKKEILPLENVHQQLSGKKFRIQIKKLMSGKLSILSYNETNDAQQLDSASTMLDIGEASKRKFDDVDQKETQDETPVANYNPTINKANIMKKGTIKKH